jgi:hypothetical protein
MSGQDDDVLGASGDLDRARASYEESLKRLSDTDALIRRADEVAGSIRDERHVNHWAEKARRVLRGAN